MRHEFALSVERETDSDTTLELPALDVADYEARIAAHSNAANLPAADASDATWDDVRPGALAAPSSETLRDIEEWISSQSTRESANERALAQLRADLAAVSARSEALATELESARNALQTALSRANDDERALLDITATAHAAEVRASTLEAELGQSRGDLATTAQRLADSESALAGARESIATSARILGEQEREQAEIRRARDERAIQVEALETELAALRVHRQEAERELMQRTESVTALAIENGAYAAAATALKHKLHATEARATAYFENLQSREWQRNVWEGMWRELDAELGDARTTIAKLDLERAELDGTLRTLRVALDDRAAAIERLEESGTAQSAALRKLADERAEHEHASRTAAQVLEARNAALVAERDGLEEARRQIAASLAARDADQTGERSVRAELETALLSLRSENTSLAARIAELESITVSVAQSLQAKTAAVQDALARLEASEHGSAEKEAKIGGLESELGAAVQAAAEQAFVTQSANAALLERAAELAAARGCLEAAERDAGLRDVRIAGLEAELATAQARAEHDAATQRALEVTLEGVSAELASESKRAASLETQHLDVSVELERAKRSLEEREFRLRHLERQAATSSQALDRIKAGILGTAQAPGARAPEYLAVSATLVPLDDESRAILLRSQRTTVGRAPENDICLTDTTISRRHVLFVLSPQGSFIEDLGSVNGVTVNGRRIRRARLAEGDVITLGLKQFRFTTHPAPEPRAH